MIWARRHGYLDANRSAVRDSGCKAYRLLRETCPAHDPDVGASRHVMALPGPQKDVT